MEQENDRAFEQLANKVSAFRHIANDINGMAQEDSGNVLNNLQSQMTNLGQGIQQSSQRLVHVMNSNPKATKMCLAAFAAFVILYYLFKLF